MLFLTGLFLPSHLVHQNVRSFQFGTKVKVKRNTPPLIALADENIAPSFVVLQAQQPLALTTPPVHVATQNTIKHVLRIKNPLLISLTNETPTDVQPPKPLKTLYLKGIKISKSQIVTSHNQPLSSSVSQQIHIASQSIANNGFNNTFTDTLNRELSEFERRWFAYSKTLEAKNKQLESHIAQITNHNTEQIWESGTAPVHKQKWVGNNIWVGLPGQTPTRPPSGHFGNFSNISGRSMVIPSLVINHKGSNLSTAQRGRSPIASNTSNNGQLANRTASTAVRKEQADVLLGRHYDESTTGMQKASDEITPSRDIQTDKLAQVSSEMTTSGINLLQGGSSSDVLYGGAGNDDLSSAADNLDANTTQRDHKLVRIEGDLTLSEGLGFLGDNNLRVVHRQCGHIVKEAEIDFQQGRFTIDIDKPSGLLQAQLRDQQGFLVSSSQILLRDFIQQRFLEGSVAVNLQMAPVQETSQQVVSVSGPKNQAPESSAFVQVSDIGKEALSDQQGRIFLPELLSGSHFMTRVQRQAHWNAIFWSNSSVSQNWHTPNRRLLQSLQSQVANVNSDLSILWGQVLKDGKPIAGVSLELADGGSVYHLTEQGQFVRGGVTSPTGYFAYTNLLPGIHLLRGESRDGLIPPKVLWLEGGHITSLNIETTEKKAEGCVFDYQTGDLLAADVREIEAEDIFTTQSDGILNLSFLKGTSPLYFEVRPHPHIFDHRPILLMSDRTHQSIDFPVPSRSWIEEIASRHKINQNPTLSIVVGYVEQAPFKVYMENASENPQLVYFNEYESTQDHEKLEDMKKGGFVLFNLEQGKHDLVLQPEGLDNQVVIKTVVTDSRYQATVFSHSL